MSKYFCMIGDATNETRTYTTAVLNNQEKSTLET